MLTLICGYPNAGKTTYTKGMENVVHLDDVGSGFNVRKKIENMDDVVVEGIYPTTKMRENLLRAYKGKHTRCIFLDITLEESIRRENRGRPRSILENFAKHFEPPTYAEGWDEIIIVRDGNETVLER